MLPHQRETNVVFTFVASLQHKTFSKLVSQALLISFNKSLLPEAQFLVNRQDTFCILDERTRNALQKILLLLLLH